MQLKVRVHLSLFICNVRGKLAGRRFGAITLGIFGGGFAALGMSDFCCMLVAGSGESSPPDTDTLIKRWQQYVNTPSYYDKLHLLLIHHATKIC